MQLQIPLHCAGGLKMNTMHKQEHAQPFSYIFMFCLYFMLHCFVSSCSMCHLWFFWPAVLFPFAFLVCFIIMHLGPLLDQSYYVCSAWSSPYVFVFVAYLSSSAFKCLSIYYLACLCRFFLVSLPCELIHKLESSRSTRMSILRTYSGTHLCRRWAAIA